MSYSAEFQKNPITFLRKYALSPPDGAAGDVLKTWSITTPGNIITGFNGRTDLSDSTVSLKKAGIEKFFADFKQHQLLPGCLTVKLGLTRTSPADFPQFWLPWDSLAITRHKLPPIPLSVQRLLNLGDSENEELYPRFFMTAGINGCSIFVDGPPTEPTVYHAGITGTLARSARDFWREQLTEAFRGTASEGRVPAGQVHSDQYMNADAEVIRRYKAWVQSSRPTFHMEVESCFGSVVGVRFGRHWSFYLQENVYIQDIEVVKRSQLTSGVDNTGKKFYRFTATNEKVDRQVTIQKRRFVPDKKIKVYSRRINGRCVPVRVSEIYPTRTFSGELKDFSVRAV